MTTLPADDELLLWREFLSLTERQSVCIANEDADGLRAALDERARVIESLDALRDGKSLALSEEAKALRDRSVQINNENEIRIRKWLTVINDEINKIKLSHRSITGYNNDYDAPETDYFDKKM